MCVDTDELTPAEAKFSAQWLKRWLTGGRTHPLTGQTPRPCPGQNAHTVGMSSSSMETWQRPWTASGCTTSRAMRWRSPLPRRMCRGRRCRPFCHPVDHGHRCAVCACAPDPIPCHGIARAYTLRSGRCSYRGGGRTANQTHNRPPPSPCPTHDAPGFEVVIVDCHDVGQNARELTNALANLPRGTLLNPLTRGGFLFVDETPSADQPCARTSSVALVLQMNGTCHRRRVQRTGSPPLLQATWDSVGWVWRVGPMASTIASDARQCL